MGTLLVWVIILLNFILQGTLFYRFSIFGVFPNTAIVIIVCFSLFSNKNKGASYGFVIGILQDILYGQALGIYALIYMIIGYCIGLINRKVFKDNLIISFFITTVATIFYIIMNIASLYVLGLEVSYSDFINISSIIQILYNSIISIFAYLYVIKMKKKGILKF